MSSYPESGVWTRHIFEVRNTRHLWGSIDILPCVLLPPTPFPLACLSACNLLTANHPVPYFHSGEVKYHLSSASSSAFSSFALLTLYRPSHPVSTLLTSALDLQMATRSYHAGPMPADMGNNNRKYSGYMNGTTHAAPAQTDAPVQHANHQVGHHPDSLGAVMSQFSSLSIPGGHIPAGSGLTQMSIHHPYIAAPEGAIAYTGYGVPVHLGNASQMPDGYPAAAFAPQYSVSGVTGAYASYPMPYPMMPFTPGRSVSYGDHNNEVPGLDYRRGSYSTTESTPATPFFGSASDRGSAARIAVMRSAYNTPSPDHAQVIGGFDRTPVTKAPTISDVDLDALLKQNPAVPRAVPAVFTPPQHMKTLEQCLENRIVGNRNVYIRGLHPTTDDELLLRYAQRFGEVEQSKAIIDTATGACKGYAPIYTYAMELCVIN